MGAHEQCVGKSDEWYTPPHVFDAIGCGFDLDVSSPGPETTPWIPARRFLTADGLESQWSGLVWMNPPFGGRNGIVPWLEKFFAHGNGIALTPDRTSAPWWQQFQPRAELTLFVGKKIRFIAGFDDPDYGIVRGQPGKSPAQGTCLMAAGPAARYALRQAAAKAFGVLVGNEV
jgi:DNA N-6-adenine-methyltransferase (Dam)